MTRTDRQLSGDAAESLVAECLARRGWVILGRNLRFGRSELDILATDPGPPARLVVVEVRWRVSRSFGGPEETFGLRKRQLVRRGVGGLVESGRAPGGAPLPALPIAVDLAVVEPGPDGRPTARLYRNALDG